MSVKRLKKPSTTKRDAAFADLADAIGAYLETVGWRAVVVGNPRVQQQPLATDLNYELVVQFAGGELRSKSSEGAP